MPRQARIDYPGALQHVIIRGNERQNIYRDNDDRIFFLKRFKYSLNKTSVKCYAWALLDNHAHFLLQTGNVPIGKCMHSLLTTYAMTFNKKYNRDGHLFQDRFYSKVCDKDNYFLELVRYIHLNPVRANMIKDLEGLKKYSWTGHQSLIGEQFNSWQYTDEVLKYFSDSPESARKLYLQFLLDGLVKDHSEIKKYYLQELYLKK